MSNTLRILTLALFVTLAACGGDQREHEYEGEDPGASAHKGLQNSLLLALQVEGAPRGSSPIPGRLLRVCARARTDVRGGEKYGPLCGV